ncbi:hypothetical protein DERP_009145 [Dermatophagoides pteronyssinus]|uniref:Uncharacterized protein n=1 Tax=Dermatophagoides pteronyssinus TaxID=6956 RepID=A0ABQ8JR91_DERPT|nr:hypothetical protein DERP_009145 [Dermatophagoides pteronyssinus]
MTAKRVVPLITPKLLPPWALLSYFRFESRSRRRFGWPIVSAGLASFTSNVVSLRNQIFGSGNGAGSVVKLACKYWPPGVKSRIGTGVASCKPTTIVRIPLSSCTDNGSIIILNE